jgi:hypothetical protein
LPARLLHDHLPRAAIGFDGGVGPQGANIAGLWYFEALNIPAASVDVMSVILGDGMDVYTNGIISFYNRPSADCGVRKGMRASEAARLMLECDPGSGARGDGLHRFRDRSGPPQCPGDGRAHGSERRSTHHQSRSFWIHLFGRWTRSQ